MTGASEGGGVVDLDSLVVLAASRGSGLRTQRAGVGVRVTARAAEWVRLNVCHPPVISVVDMVAVHVRRRAVRTDFVAGALGLKGTLCLVWRPGDRGRDLTIAFEDELRSGAPGGVPGSGTSVGDRWGGW